MIEIADLQSNLEVASIFVVHKRGDRVVQPIGRLCGSCPLCGQCSGGEPTHRDDESRESNVTFHRISSKARQYGRKTWRNTATITSRSWRRYRFLRDFGSCT